MRDRKDIKIIFHIGLERTGTTSIQKTCSKHADRLRGNGVLYPRGCAFRRFNHGPLASAYLPSTRPDDIYLPPRGIERDELLKGLFAEIEGSGVHTVVLSSEYFSSRFEPTEIERLAADFSHYDCRICVVLRDHVSRFVSSYATHVVSGSQLTFDEYAALVLRPDAPQLRYRMIVERWRAVFGGDAVTVMDYDAQEDAVGRFFAALNLPRIDTASCGARRYNPSLDAAGTEALRLINCQLGTDHDRPSRDYVVEPALRLLLKACARRWGRASPHWTLHPRNQELLGEVKTADLNWLASEYGLVLRSSAGTAFTFDRTALRTRDAEAERLVRRLGWIWKPYAALARTRAYMPMRRDISRIE